MSILLKKYITWNHNVVDGFFPLFSREKPLSWSIAEEKEKHIGEMT